MTVPAMILISEAEVPTVLASSTRFCPSIGLMRLVAPMPILPPTAWITAISEKTTPTAADAAVSIFATKYVSAVL